MAEIEQLGDGHTVERATRDDVPSLVALLADDVLGSARESADLERYLTAFDAVDADPNQFLAVVRDKAGTICGTCQLTLIPGLSRGGATRLQVEAVRTSSAVRGKGLGRAMFDWAHAYGRDHGATLAQLTTDKQRPDAHRFYEARGYTASHEGYKRPL